MLDSLRKLREAKRVGNEIEISFAIVALEKELVGLKSYVGRRIRDANQDLHESVLQEADDVMNDALMKIVDKVHRFRGLTEGEANAWTRKIVKNLLADGLRKAVRREILACLNYFFKAKKRVEERQEDKITILIADASLDATFSALEGETGQRRKKA